MLKKVTSVLVPVQRFYKSTRVLTSTRRCLHDRIDFTKNTFKVIRGNYNYLHENHIKYFEDLLGWERMIMDLADLEKYNVDWYYQVRGNSGLVLKPKTTEEVSKILSFCDLNRLAVCLQGGNTGVNGGSVPVFDEIILSTELMNEIINFDTTSGIIVCQAGCILENIDNVLMEKNLTVPLDIQARGSCQIGGNVSTNAGGVRLLRYGNMHGNVLGIEAVKANGEVIDCLSTLKKDNTGYHLKHLFIGSEGTLGVVTKVALQCPAKPATKNVAFIGLQDFSKVLKTFGEAKRHLGEILSAVEVIDAPSMDFIKEYNKLDSPIGEYPYYLLIETAGSNEEHDSEKIRNFFETALKRHWILNGTVTNESKKMDALWNIRDVSIAYKICGPILLFDISLPLEEYYNLVDEMRVFLGDDALRVFGYGHLGDSNLHLQIQLREHNEVMEHKTVDHLYKRVTEIKGSISAEHGLGFLKGNYLNSIKPPNVVRLMWDLKRIFDPNGILNPYKVFPH